MEILKAETIASSKPITSDAGKMSKVVEMVLGVDNIETYCSCNWCRGLWNHFGTNRIERTSKRERQRVPLLLLYLHRTIHHFGLHIHG